MENKNNGLLQDLIDTLNRMKAEYENSKVKCGIIGMSGSGKSSLINAIAGEKIAQVGSTEQTLDPQEYQHGGLYFVDLPGCSTQKWPKASYINDLKLNEYDCFIIVTANRFFEDDAFLYSELNNKLKKPCFLVRNKFDLAVYDEKFDNDLTEEETREKIIKNICENLRPLQPQKIYLTSARFPKKYDFPELLIDISTSLDGIKRQRFVADMCAWNEKAFLAKRKVAEKLVTIYSGLAAANGLNPIIGLDVSIDVSLLLKLSKEISQIYGLTNEQFKYTQNYIVDEPTLRVLKQKVAQYIAKYLLKEGIIKILEALGKREALKIAAKYIPLLGSAIAAGLGYKLTYNFGDDLIEESEKLAKELLEDIIENT
jgi:GTPase Era involved in 16S rRNA processing/uncharacterized protein (DUF697 family)